MDNRITVLIPNYNGSKFLPDLFESLIAQTYQGFDCIFLDDGSSDNSISVANSYLGKIPNLEVRELPNVGIAQNWNRGLELVTSEFFTLLHCDDAYEPEYLAELLALMDQFPGAALGHCGALTMDETGKEIYSPIESFKKGKYLPSRAFCRSVKDEYGQLMSGDYITCPAVMFRTSIVGRVGFFNENLSQTLDWEYWFRVLLSEQHICGTNLCLYRYRRHSNNLSLQNAADMKRYREELATLEWAHKLGIENGLLIDSALDASVVVNILIYDIGLALVSREDTAAKRKLQFLIQQALISGYLKNILSLLIYLGRPGGWLLLKCIAVAVMGISTMVKSRSWFGEWVDRTF
ncbi:MAG: glycosyltransferase involved in cell wall biosynthesis [Candidatus Azotimanducaceae bacterium]|jgi:glycosyltransferase involved in cell wall biosynthesis